MDLSWLDSVIINEDGGIDIDPLYCDGERDMIIETVIDTAVFVEYDIESIAHAVKSIPLKYARELEAFAILASETVGRHLYELRSIEKNSYAEAFALARLAEVKEQISKVANALHFDLFTEM